MVTVDYPTTGFLADILASRRLAAEARMVDVCEIRTESTKGPFDPATGRYPEIPGTLLYGPSIAPDHGRCERNTGRARLETVAEAGGHDTIIARTEVRIPATAPRIERDCEVTMVTCRNDPQSNGIKYHVEGPGMKTWATAQRINVTEIVG